MKPCNFSGKGTYRHDGPVRLCVQNSEADIRFQELVQLKIGVFVQEAKHFLLDRHSARICLLQQRDIFSTWYCAFQNDLLIGTGIKIGCTSDSAERVGVDAVLTTSEIARLVSYYHPLSLLIAILVASRKIESVKKVSPKQEFLFRCPPNSAAERTETDSYLRK